jgi:hypothetical protein
VLGLLKGAWGWWFCVAAVLIFLPGSMAPGKKVFHRGVVILGQTAMFRAASDFSRLDWGRTARPQPLIFQTFNRRQTFSSHH